MTKISSKTLFGSSFEFGLVLGEAEGSELGEAEDFEAELGEAEDLGEAEGEALDLAVAIILLPIDPVLLTHRFVLGLRILPDSLFIYLNK